MEPNKDKQTCREYDDIMNLPHHVSAVHAPMPLKDRAAQFSPFAALTGYSDIIREETRIHQESDRKEN